MAIQVVYMYMHAKHGWLTRLCVHVQVCTLGCVHMHKVLGLHVLCMCMHNDFCGVHGVAH